MISFSGLSELPPKYQTDGCHVPWPGHKERVSTIITHLMADHIRLILVLRAIGSWRTKTEMGGTITAGISLIQIFV